jgi:isochorismate hydrolase
MSRRHERFAFRPDSAALLVIDMQRYFTAPSSHAYVPSSGKIIPNIIKLAAAFEKMGRPVIFTRHVDADTEGMMYRWWRDRIREDSEESAIDRRLKTGAGRVLVKHQYDAFFGTGLEKMLRRSGAAQVAVTGVVTHLCCETTARSAFMRGFEVFFVTDATADYGRAYHNASVQNLAHGFAVTVTADALLRAWTSRRS